MAGDPFHERLSELGPALLNALAAFEDVRRRLHPPQIPGLREAVQPIAARLDARARGVCRDARARRPRRPRRATRQSAAAAERVGELLRRRLAGGGDPARPARHARALPRPGAALSAAQRAAAGEPLLLRAGGSRSRRRARRRPAPDTPTGIITARRQHGARGGFSLYVPEYYDAARAWPLMVALHGGSGTGDDFLWTWLTEARSRGCLLMSPTSLGSTWSLMGPDVDAEALRAMLATSASTGRSTPTASSSPASPTAPPTPCSAAFRPTCRSPRWRRCPASCIPRT